MVLTIKMFDFQGILYVTFFLGSIRDSGMYLNFWWTDKQKRTKEKKTRIEERSRTYR